MHEIKWDGWRLQVHKWFKDVRLFTRRERDVTSHFPIHSLRRRRPTALAVVFDLLFLDGVDLRHEPWTKRRRQLQLLMARSPTEGLHLSEVWDDGAALLRAAGEKGLEGIVSKHRNASYKSGPTDAWLKTKVPGWTEANRGRFKR